MTMLNLKTEGNASQSGNVLFLILIAVALFVALSYAVTQSTRSGGGDASRETSLVNAASITQYPASIKTAITRMIVSNGTGTDDLLFDPPSNFAALTTTTLQSQAVFFPGSTTGGGGGATYALAPANVMVSAAPGAWTFNRDNQIKDIGTYDATLSATNADVIAFLPGVTLAICQSIHQRLGLTTTIPVESNAVVLTNLMVAGNTPGTTGNTITGGGVLDGQPQGCFQKPALTYNYYHVLVER